MGVMGLTIKLGNPGRALSFRRSVKIEHSKSSGPISSVLVGHGTKKMQARSAVPLAYCGVAAWRPACTPGGSKEGTTRSRGEEEETSQGLGKGQGHYWTFPQNTEVPLTISAPPRLRVVPLVRPVVPGVVAFWAFPLLPSLALTSCREGGARLVVQRKGSRGDAETRRRRGDEPRAWEGARPPLDRSAKHRSSPHNLRASAAPRGPTRAARCAWRCRVLGLPPFFHPLHSLRVAKGGR